jgi:hypothetical protein
MAHMVALGMLRSGYPAAMSDFLSRMESEIPQAYEDKRKMPSVRLALILRGKRYFMVNTS